MVNKTSKLIVLLALLCLALLAVTGGATSAAGAVNFTILHTNDFHGQLEASGSNPGGARVAAVINGVRSSVGAANVLTVDGGDEMQGSLLSNLQKGLPTIATFNAMLYDAATLGNHEFDWGQSVLKDRTTQATYPFLSANIVKNDTGNCSTAGWTVPDQFKVQPYLIRTVGTAPDTVRVGFIGVTTTEVPVITIASATAGLCFKDPTASILHYYDEVKGQADVIVVLSHLGNLDGGYGYGIPVIGDQTLAKNLINAGKPAALIIGGHSHTNMSAAQVITVSGKPGQTSVVQAYYNGRKVGRADLSWDPATGNVTVNWQSLSVSTSGTEDLAVKAVIAGYASDPAYQAQINQPVGYTQVDLLRDYNGDNMMGNFINDAIYNSLNTDGDTANDIDLFFNNAGGIRIDWCAKEDPANPGTYIWSSTAADCTKSGVWSHTPMLLNYGQMFQILPFGNATVVGTMTGAQILEVLNQSATLGKGAIQPSGIRYKFYRYSDAKPGPQPYAWGAFEPCVVNKATHACDPLDVNKTYKVGTNEFLAPSGGDNYGGFKYMQNITYWGDMLNAVNSYVSAQYTAANPYKGPNGDGNLDGRVSRDGNDATGSIIPITLLHNNDSHGNLAKGTFVGYTQLAAIIQQERAHNPSRTLLLAGGDQVQGDAMMYYFKSAPSGFAADGTPLPPALQTHPMMAVMNSLGYDAMTLGNHEFNFGSDVFKGIFKQANFTLLGANVTDNGAYGLSQVGPGGEGVKPYLTRDLGGVKIAIVGITNHRVPNYELPSNIVGLTFGDPLATAQTQVNALRGSNDVVVALTHIGFTQNPKSVEVDNNVDTVMAGQTTGLDAIVGSHSHTDPSKQTDYSGAYKYLPTIVGGPNHTPVLITQAYRYNNYLGEVVIGVRAKPGGGYEVVSRAGQYIAIVNSPTATPEDPATKAVVDPYAAQLVSYNNKTVGQTTAPIDTMQAFTAETNGANLQADASMWELKQHGITPDFHLSGAMTNKLMASGATPGSPVTLKISDMFAGMPYENSLVTMRMNGPQLKAVLERAYRNYFYYKYVPGYGGYSYYTTCMLDTNAGNQITYNDLNPALPNGNNVVSLVIGGKAVDFSDATKFYVVSTVNYLAAGSCNFNDSGVSLWPLNQIVNDTQYYVRDAVIDYITAQGTVSPAIEGRLQFPSNTTAASITASVPTGPKFDDGTKTFVTSESVIRIATNGACSLSVAGPDGTTHPACQSGNNDLKLTGKEGTYTITANVWGQGTAGASYTGTFVLDNTAPTVLIHLPVAQGIYQHSALVTPNFAVTDGSSGVGPVNGLVDGVTMTNGKTFDMYDLTLGDHTLIVTATDKVGNAASASVKFSIEATFKSTIAGVNRLFKEKKITNIGVRDSLIAKLKAAQSAMTNPPGGSHDAGVKAAKLRLAEFIKMVQNQTGKSITKAAAQDLIADAQWISDHLK